jgi:hypothetical protein
MVSDDSIVRVIISPLNGALIEALVIYSSWTRGFDGQIPQAKRLLVLEQSLDLASVDQELHDVTTLQVPMYKSMLYLLFEKIGTRET